MGIERLAALVVFASVGTGACLAGTDDEPSQVTSAATPRCGGFTDVATTDPSCDAVARIKERGITSGCNPPKNTRYCAEDPVTRGQAATFLARALDLPSGRYPCGFEDVAKDDPHREAICAVKRAGISVGCNPPDNDAFCPKDVITRGQAAIMLARAAKLPGCDLSNYMDVPRSHPFARSICGAWKAGITVSYLHPDPVRNRYNNTFGPDAPLSRGEMAILLDRAFIEPVDDPLRVEITGPYQDALRSAARYEFSPRLRARPGEVLSLVYVYRAARKVKNLPGGVDLSALLAKIQRGADEIMRIYRSDCFAGHDGSGTRSVGCARFDEAPDSENLDAGSNFANAVLETARLLLEVGGSANVTKAKTYFARGLAVADHMNGDHLVTSPCLGWECDATAGETDGKIKWNKSNRYAIVNALVADIRERFPKHVGAGGAPYLAKAAAAAACFRNDLRNASKYRCARGKRCYDGESGPWWTGWHSAYPEYARIEDDVGHGGATAELLFHAVYDDWGVFSYADLDQFRKHFEHRRLSSSEAPRTDGAKGWQLQIPIRPDSDLAQRNSCALGAGCLGDEWEARKNGAWIRLASLYGQNRFRSIVRDLEPTWSEVGPGNYLGLMTAAFALFGEVGSPRRLDL